MFPLTFNLTYEEDVTKSSLEALLEAAVMQLALLRVDEAGMRDLLTGKGDTVVLIQYSPSTTKTKPGWALWYQPTGKTLVLALRGTTNERQWFYHIHGTWGVQYSRTGSGKHVLTHYGMEHGATEAYAAVTAALAGGLKPERIVVMGHSYGAGVATWIARSLVYDGFQRETILITFGSPRVFTSEIAVEPGVMVRVQHEGDVVCSSPSPVLVPRNIVANVITGWGFGTAAFGAISRRIGTVGFGEISPSIGNWKHMGRGLNLFRNGELRAAVPPENSSTAYFDDPGTLQFEREHVMDTAYWPSLKAAVNRQGALTPHQIEIIGLGDEIAEDPIVPSTDPPWTDLEEAIRDAVNAEVYRYSTPPAVADLERAEAIAFDVFVPARRDSIGAAYTGVGSMATFKFTAYISWGTYGRSVSIHKTGLATIQNAYDAGIQWVNNYTNMFGRKFTAPPQEGEFLLGAPGSPVVEWLRVSDPLTPRLSQRFRVPGSNGIGFNATGPGYGSDVPWVGISFTVAATAGGRQTRDTVSLLGQPDKVIEDGGINLAVIVPGGTTYSTAVHNYLRTILPPDGGAFGTMGRDIVSAPDVPVLAFTVITDGSVSITAPDADWVTGEYVRLVGTKVPYYNREWRVHLNVDGTYNLLGSRGSQGPLPKDGKGYRTRLKSGIKQQVFYAYSTAFDSFKLADVVFIAKRNPAKKYVPLASSRRRRTPAK